MPVNTNDINQIRVGVLGISVDESQGGSTTASQDGKWISTGPGSDRNTLNTAERIITRVINELETKIIGTKAITDDFNRRFNDVVGNEVGADQAEFDALGKNLIQTIHDLITGGGGGGVGEPTDDGKLYGRSRQSGILLGTWEEITAMFPSGGAQGDLLAKASATDNDVEWITPASGGGANPSDTNPIMDGTATPGTASTFSRADHIHPTDTSRASASDLSDHEDDTIAHITGTERTAWNAKADASALSTLETTVNNFEFIKDVTYNSTNGDLTFTFRDNTTLTANVFVENLAEDIDFDSTTKELVITKKDGTEIRVDVSDLVTVYTGSNGAHIQISIATGNVIEAVLKAGTVDETELSAALLGKINGKLDTTSADFLPLSGGILTGALTLAGEPTTNSQAATKKYVDEAWELV